MHTTVWTQPLKPRLGLTCFWPTRVLQKSCCVTSVARSQEALQYLFRPPRILPLGNPATNNKSNYLETDMLWGSPTCGHGEKLCQKDISDAQIVLSYYSHPHWSTTQVSKDSILDMQPSWAFSWLQCQPSYRTTTTEETPTKSHPVEPSQSDNDLFLTVLCNR